MLVEDPASPGGTFDMEVAGLHSTDFFALRELHHHDKMNRKGTWRARSPPPRQQACTDAELVA